MINKKVIVGILAILVLLTTTQGLKPVLASGDADHDDVGYSNLFVSVSNGQGNVCWTGSATGCTTTATNISIQRNMPLTFTATATNGFHFVNWNTYSTINPYTVTLDGNDQYVSANFSA